MKRFTYSLMACVAALTFAGCEPATTDTDSTVMTEDDSHAAESHMAHEAQQGHVHAAPHGGHMITLGEDAYDLEVVYPDADGNLHLYLLGDHATAPVAIAAEDIEFELDGEGGEETEVALTPVNPTDGKASEFTATPDALGGAEDIEGLHGHVHVTIEGTEYEGELEHNHGEGEHAAEMHDADGDAVEEVPAE